MKIKIRKRDIAIPAVLLLTATTITLFVWTAYAPPDFQRTIYEWNSFGQPTKSRGLCAYDDAIPYAITLGFVFLVSIELAIRGAYEARKVSVEFAETEYIVLTLVTICGIGVFGILLWFLMDHSPSARFVVVSAQTFLVSMAMLLLIFIPKIRFKTEVRRKTREKTAFNGGDRITMNTGGGNLAITGLNFSTDKNPSSIDDDSDMATPGFGKRASSGMMVLSHPKEFDMRKVEYYNLKKEYYQLQKINKNMTKGIAKQ